MKTKPVAVQCLHLTITLKPLLLGGDYEASLPSKKAQVIYLWLKGLILPYAFLPKPTNENGEK
tara:strand:+ start:630 stop:818 length:189 start_codon:yes stop_codon:yes gene_type:complete